MQHDLSPLWDLDIDQKVVGAVVDSWCGPECCPGRKYEDYFNFTNPVISSNLDKNRCGWLYGVNIFNLQRWRKTNITAVYHQWLKLVSLIMVYFLQYIFILFDSLLESVIMYMYSLLCRASILVSNSGIPELFHLLYLHLKAISTFWILRGTYLVWGTGIHEQTNTWWKQQPSCISAGLQSRGSELGPQR